MNCRTRSSNAGILRPKTAVHNIIWTKIITEGTILVLDNSILFLNISSFVKIHNITQAWTKLVIAMLMYE